MSFLILSPPRCMTAWLANLLTDGTTLCHHDAMAHGGLKRLEALAGPNIGFAETAGMYVPRRLRQLFPAAPVVVVLADMARVAASLRALGVDGDAFVHDFAARVADTAEVYCGQALFVRDSEVATRAAEIAEHLTGRAPDPRRLELLRSLQVTKLDPFAGDPMAAQELRKGDA